jgi:CheY-like chemotaxis protein
VERLGHNFVVKCGIISTQTLHPEGIPGIFQFGKQTMLDFGTIQPIQKKTYLTCLPISLKTMPQSHETNRTASAVKPPNYILIGEDDLDDEELLTEIFNSVDKSFAQKFFNNGQKLLNHLKEIGDHELPCLILLDYNMPEMNAAELLREIKNDSRYDHIPKVIWSTSKSNLYRDISLELNATDYIIKPSNVKELTEAVRHMLSFCHS